MIQKAPEKISGRIAAAETAKNDRVCIIIKRSILELLKRRFAAPKEIRTVPILWTFENPEKMLPFTATLLESDIPYEILSKNGKVDAERGLIISVDEADYKKAKKVLLKYRKRNSNRHNK